MSPEMDRLKEEMAQAAKEAEEREAVLMAREAMMTEELQRKEAALAEARSSMSTQAQGLVETTLTHANVRHEEMMANQRQQHQAQIEQLQNQLVWMTAVAGEDRVQEVMNNSDLHAESVRRAMELGQSMIQQNHNLSEDDW